MQNAECRVKARGERLFFAVGFILNSIFGVVDFLRRGDAQATPAQIARP